MNGLLSPHVFVPKSKPNLRERGIKLMGTAQKLHLAEVESLEGDPNAVRDVGDV